MIDGGHVANAPLPTLLIAARQAFDSIGRRFPWQVRSQFATLAKKLKLMSGNGQSIAPLAQIIARVLPGYPFAGTERSAGLTSILRVVP